MSVATVGGNTAHAVPVERFENAFYPTDTAAQEGCAAPLVLCTELTHERKLRVIVRLHSDQEINTTRLVAFLHQQGLVDTPEKWVIHRGLQGVGQEIKTVVDDETHISWPMQEIFFRRV